MMCSIRILTALTCVVLSAASAAFAQGEYGRIAGRVSDDSGALLPGVAVAIVAPALSAPVIVVTDRAGQYSSPPLAPGTYSVSFELFGFETVRTAGIRVRAGEVSVLNGRLEVAPVRERVEVIGAAPPPAEPARPLTPPLPPPTPVAAEALAALCAPGQPRAVNAGLGKIIGHRDDRDRTLFGDRDILLLDVGETAGAAVGHNYVVRRRLRVGDKTLPIQQATFGEDTAGLVQVVATTPHSSVAVVVHACGEFVAGDVVEHFEALPPLVALEAGTAHYEDPARIILGEHGKEMAAPQQLMVIDRGTAQGVRRGQRLTVFRRTDRGRGPIATIADGVIVAVRDNSATIRLDRASDAVSIGDLVALHRRPD